MIRSYVSSREVTKDRGWRTFFTLSHFSVATAVVVLVLGGIVIALLLGGGFGRLGLYVCGVVIGAIIIALVVFLRQDELAATIVIAVHLYVDWYLGIYVLAPIVTLALLVIFFLARSPRHPWIEPRALWLWALFLVLSIFPAIRGATNLYDTAFYYPNIIFGALIFFWLGTVIARDSACIRRLFQILAGFATLIAVHTIIQAITGVFLLGTSSHDAFLANVSYFRLGLSNAHRVGSFFTDPNWNGTFFEMMLFIPLGLFVESSSLLGKALYLAETLLMLPALLFTYSNGAWVGAFAGVIAFIIFTGRTRYRVLLPLLILSAAVVIIVYFPSQLALQLQHAANPSELSLRLGIWQTAIRVISAFPLTGIGFGHYTYLAVADPYRSAAQYVPEDHPHNSYLELGAMAGLPVLLVFVALLSFFLWKAFRNWAMASVGTRSLLGAGITAIIALSVNSISINAWTLPPLAALGWLILGAITSPLLRKTEVRIKEKNPS